VGPKGPKGDRGPASVIKGETGEFGCKGFFKFGGEVTVTEQPTELFPSGAAQSGAVGPLVITINRSGEVLIQFSGVVALGSGAKESGLRYQVLLDGQPILPTVPEISLQPVSTGDTVAVTAMPFLTRGTHTVQVVATAGAGTTYTARNLALTAKGVLD
jgi:hypothetical protein